MSALRKRLRAKSAGLPPARPAEVEFADVFEDLISLLENRHCRASRKTRQKLADVLDCSTIDLLLVGGVA